MTLATVVVLGILLFKGVIETIEMILTKQYDYVGILLNIGLAYFFYRLASTL